MEPNVSLKPLILRQSAAARYIGISYFTLWRKRNEHPLYYPENYDPKNKKKQGHGKAVWYSVRRLELIAEVMVGELEPDQAYSILTRELTARRTEYALTIAGKSVEVMARKFERRRRTLEAKKAKEVKPS